MKWLYERVIHVIKLKYRYSDVNPQNNQPTKRCPLIPSTQLQQLVLARFTA